MSSVEQHRRAVIRQDEDEAWMRLMKQHHRARGEVLRYTAKMQLLLQEQREKELKELSRTLEGSRAIEARQKEEAAKIQAREERHQREMERHEQQRAAREKQMREKRKQAERDLELERRLADRDMQESQKRKEERAKHRDAKEVHFQARCQQKAKTPQPSGKVATLFPEFVGNRRPTVKYEADLMAQREMEQKRERRFLEERRRQNLELVRSQERTKKKKKELEAERLNQLLSRREELLQLVDLRRDVEIEMLQRKLHSPKPLDSIGSAPSPTKSLHSDAMSDKQSGLFSPMTPHQRRAESEEASIVRNRTLTLDSSRKVMYDQMKARETQERLLEEARQHKEAQRRREEAEEVERARRRQEREETEAREAINREVHLAALKEERARKEQEYYEDLRRAREESVLRTQEQNEAAQQAREEALATKRHLDFLKEEQLRKAREAALQQKLEVVDQRTKVAKAEERRTAEQKQAMALESARRKKSRELTSLHRYHRGHDGSVLSEKQIARQMDAAVQEEQEVIRRREEKRAKMEQQLRNSIQDQQKKKIARETELLENEKAYKLHKTKKPRVLPVKRAPKVPPWERDYQPHPELMDMVNLQRDTDIFMSEMAQELQALDKKTKKLKAI